MVESKVDSRGGKPQLAGRGDKTIPGRSAPAVPDKNTGYHAGTTSTAAGVKPSGRSLACRRFRPDAPRRRRGAWPESPRRAVPNSMAGRAVHIANTNGSSVQLHHSSPKSQTNSNVPAGDWMARSPISSTASAWVSPSVGSDRQRLQPRRQSIALGQQDLHQGHAGARAVVQSQRADLRRSARGQTT